MKTLSALEKHKVVQDEWWPLHLSRIVSLSHCAERVITWSLDSVLYTVGEKKWKGYRWSNNTFCWSVIVHQWWNQGIKELDKLWKLLRKHRWLLNWTIIRANQNSGGAQYVMSLCLIFETYEWYNNIHKMNEKLSFQWDILGSFVTKLHLFATN